MPTNTAIDQPSPLLKEQEVAKILKLEVSTLRRWRWEGRGIPFLKLEGAVRYDINTVREYLSSQRRTSTSDTGEAA